MSDKAHETEVETVPEGPLSRAVTELERRLEEIREREDAKASLADALERLDDNVVALPARRGRAGARKLTISMKRLSRTDLERGRAEYPERNDKPWVRAECVDGPRPCPFVSCRYHLYVDVHPVRGSITINHPDLEVWELTETCALDVAETEHTLEEVGELMNLTRERVRQIETHGLAMLRRRATLAGLDALLRGDDE